MSDALDIFLSDTSSESEAEERRRALDASPELRAQVRGLQRSLESLRSRWDEAVPDRRILVLLALQEDGRDDLLSDDDLALLRQEREACEALRTQFASYDDVRAAIHEDARAFESAWEAGELPAKRQDRPAAPRRSHLRSRWMWRVPVAAALVAFGILAYLLQQRSSAFETVATGQDEIEMIEFADGSTIRLMENSTLSYVPEERQTPINRRAQLRGRAIFDIAPQQRGFVVETPTAVATVLGTMFGVDATEEVTDVVLVEGRLALSEIDVRERVVTLSPGERSRVEAGAMPTAPEAVDVSMHLEWSGLFIFRSLPLEEIAQRLGDFYDVQIDVDQTLINERITGTFEQTEPLEQILRTVAAAVNARVEETEVGFTIRPA